MRDGPCATKGSTTVKPTKPNMPRWIEKRIGSIGPCARTRSIDQHCPDNHNDPHASSSDLRTGRPRFSDAFRERVPVAAKHTLGAESVPQDSAALNQLRERPTWLFPADACPADVMPIMERELHYDAPGCKADLAACAANCRAHDANACYALALVIQELKACTRRSGCPPAMTSRRSARKPAAAASPSSSCPSTMSAPASALPPSCWDMAAARNRRCAPACAPWLQTSTLRTPAARNRSRL